MRAPFPYLTILKDLNSLLLENLFTGLGHATLLIDLKNDLCSIIWNIKTQLLILDHLNLSKIKENKPFTIRIKKGSSL